MPERRSIQSVAVHLKSIYLVLEKGYGFEKATEAMREVLARQPGFVWLDPPPSLGEITVLDVVEARGLAEHIEVVGRWARSAWEAWALHHEAIRRWSCL